MSNSNPLPVSAEDLDEIRDADLSARAIVLDRETGKPIATYARQLSSALSRASKEKALLYWPRRRSLVDYSTSPIRFFRVYGTQILPDAESKKILAGSVVRKADDPRTYVALDTMEKDGKNVVRIAGLGLVDEDALSEVPIVYVSVPGGIAEFFGFDSPEDNLRRKYDRDGERWVFADEKKKGRGTKIELELELDVARAVLADIAYEATSMRGPNDSTRYLPAYRRGMFVAEERLEAAIAAVENGNPAPESPEPTPKTPEGGTMENESPKVSKKAREVLERMKAEDLLLLSYGNPFVGSLRYELRTRTRGFVASVHSATAGSLIPSGLVRPLRVPDGWSNIASAYEAIAPEPKVDEPHPTDVACGDPHCPQCDAELETILLGAATPEVEYPDWRTPAKFDELLSAYANLPEFSRKVFDAVDSWMHDGEPGYSCYDVDEVASALEVKPLAVNAALSRLYEADLLYGEDTDVNRVPALFLHSRPFEEFGEVKFSQAGTTEPKFGAERVKRYGGRTGTVIARRGGKLTSRVVYWLRWDDDGSISEPIAEYLLEAIEPEDEPEDGLEELGDPLPIVQGEVIEGDLVRIFHDPITRQEFEGTAVLVERISTGPASSHRDRMYRLERWAVCFDEEDLDGDIVERTVRVDYGPAIVTEISEDVTVKPAALDEIISKVQSYALTALAARDATNDEERRVADLEGGTLLKEILFGVKAAKDRIADLESRLSGGKEGDDSPPSNRPSEIIAKAVLERLEDLVDLDDVSSLGELYSLDLGFERILFEEAANFIRSKDPTFEPEKNDAFVDTLARSAAWEIDVRVTARNAPEGDYDPEPYICPSCGRAYWKSTGTGVCSSCNSEYEYGKTLAREIRETRELFGEEAAAEYERGVESRNPDPGL